MSELLKNENTFYSEISELLKQTRSIAYKSVNTIMVQTYWQIGKRIVEQEQQGQYRANYGDFLITNLSRHLSDTIGKGFSEANLWNIRQFYLVFPDFDQFSTHCVENLTWTNIRMIMRLDSQDERTYYIKESSEQNWSSRVLERHIKTGYYRRLLSTQQKEDITVISDVDRQMRISTETSHFYVDLVFYNYLLKCFVIIDLKTSKLTHADIGQMDMYVRMFDALKRIENDNPTIGIILCAEKDETIVKYSILKENKQLFASKYKTVLPTEEELAEMISREKQKLIE
jgi:hypothetical protein